MVELYASEGLKWFGFFYSDKVQERVMVKKMEGLVDIFCNLQLMD